MPQNVVGCCVFVLLNVLWLQNTQKSIDKLLYSCCYVVIQYYMETWSSTSLLYWNKSSFPQRTDDLARSQYCYLLRTVNPVWPMYTTLHIKEQNTPWSFLSFVNKFNFHLYQTLRVAGHKQCCKQYAVSRSAGGTVSSLKLCDRRSIERVTCWSSTLTRHRQIWSCLEF